MQPSSPNFPQQSAARSQANNSSAPVPHAPSSMPCDQKTRTAIPLDLFKYHLYDTMNRLERRLEYGLAPDGSMRKEQSPDSTSNIMVAPSVAPVNIQQKNLFSNGPNGSMPTAGCWVCRISAGMMGGCPTTARRRDTGGLFLLTNPHLECTAQHSTMRRCSHWLQLASRLLLQSGP